MSIKNDSCIFRSKAECEDCLLKDELDCHFNVKKLLRFGVSFSIIIVFISIGMLLNGLRTEFIIYLIVFIIFAIIFFEFWEIRILCSHCPFYAENKKTLHCYGNYGCLKVWKYHPEPMSKSEKIQFIIGLAIFFSLLLVPAIILILNQLYLWSILTIIGIIFFLINMRKYHCPKCFNFSCPLNKKPKNIIDGFLKRNPVMREAWEKSGWKIAE